MVKVEDPRFRHLKKKVGFFTVAALAVVAVVILLIGKENDLFTKKYELRFTVDKGTGFTRGMSVKLSGFRIGRLKSISLNEEAKVDIVIQIDQKYQKWIRKDSTAKLVKEGLVGDGIIEVSVGSTSLDALKDQEKLAYVKTKALDELADELANKVQPVLNEVRGIIGYLNDPDGDIKQSMKNFNILARNMDRTRERADTLLQQTGGQVSAMSGKVVTLLDGTNDTMQKANSSISTLEQKLPGLLTTAESTLSNIEKISGDLKAAEQTLLPKVSPLLQKSDDTLQGASNVLNAVQGIWPLSSHVKPPQEKQFVPGDSHE